MTESDIPEVARIEKMIFADPWSEKVYRETLKLPETGYVVATDVSDDGEEIIGAAGVRNIVGTGEITNVMILPGYRGRGIAKMMLTELLETGRQLGACDFTLEVRVSNEPAIRLYESLGFESEGVRPGFYRNPAEDAAIYWLRQ
ncbi:MAG: ribosomal protein S18-alanine N-acetyltransferase [Lachnospiraceae bacterium]|nr:ribosomal protein S18-alanine N-acetyltransferase [Lachnospiraceae bacterium]